MHECTFWGDTEDTTAVDHMHPHGSYVSPRAQENTLIETNCELTDVNLEHMVLMYLNAVFSWHLMLVAMTVLIVRVIMY